MSSPRVVSRRKRPQKPNTLQQVIALSCQCSLAWNNGASELAFQLMAERDELCKKLTPEDRQAYLAWARQQFTDAQWREFGEALAGMCDLIFGEGPMEDWEPIE